ncbi:MAG: helix-turn-helix domain-containing protein, partial [Candidatus Bathyarchaeota archaeon]
MKGTIKDTLRKFGLSENEIEVYILLGKSGPKKGFEITKHLKINKGQVYRILKNLEKKGIIESTLEHPKRFLAVSLEKVIDSFIKSKRKEVDQIEQTKEDLLSDWRKIKQIQLDSSYEKFSVIEGEKKIFNKISQMIKETKNEFVSIASVYGMLRAINFGIFEEVKNHRLQEKISFLFLTQITKDDIKAVKTILEHLTPEINVKGRHPNRISSVFPRLAIKDKNEILLFISREEKIETALYTDCKSIIESFYGVFRDLWKSSADIRKRVIELETGKIPSIMELIKDPIVGKKKYFDALETAQKEILIVTSSEGLLNISKNINLMKKWSKKGVRTKIMAPITNQNLDALQTLSVYCEIKHIPIGYRETTIIDGNSLFQLDYPVINNPQDGKAMNFENVFFTNNSEYIKRTSENLLDAWMKNHTPPGITLNSVIQQNILPNKKDELAQTSLPLQRVREYKHLTDQKITEEIVQNKIKNLKRYPINNPSRDNETKIYRSFGSAGMALIHPHPQLNLPELIIGIAMFNDESSYGATNHLMISAKNRTSSDSIYEPVAIVDTNPYLIDYRRMVYKGDPVEHNVRLVKDSEFKIFVQGNSLFASWTIPIPLLSGNHVLPPSSILFEGYGEVKSGF